MSEIDGRLAEELDRFYDKIERRELPPSLAAPRLEDIKRGRRSRERIKTAAGLAAVAVGAAAFLVIGLVTHHAVNGAPGGAAIGPVAGSPSPSPSRMPSA